MRISILFIFFLLSANVSYAVCPIVQDIGLVGSGGSGLLNIGQGLTAPCSGVLKSVTAYTSGTPFDNGIPAVTIEIYTGSNGAIGSPIFTQSFNASPNLIPYNINSHVFSLANGPELTATSVYSIIFNTHAAIWFPLRSDKNEYAGGALIEANTTIVATDDLRFSVEIATPGDVDGNNAIELTDAILSMRVITALPTGEDVFVSADVNDDGFIGLPEVIHVLDSLSGQ